MKTELNKLIDPAKPDNSIKPAQAPAAIRAKTNLSSRAAAEIDGEVVTVESTDGYFTFTVKVVR